MTELQPGAPPPDQNLFEVTILSPDALQAVHQREGHVYTFKVQGAAGERVLSAPEIRAGNPAHDPLAFRHAAILRAQAAAAGAQMIDKEHSVVSIPFRQPDRR